MLPSAIYLVEPELQPLSAEMSATVSPGVLASKPPGASTGSKTITARQPRPVFVKVGTGFPTLTNTGREYFSGNVPFIASFLQERKSPDTLDLFP